MTSWYGNEAGSERSVACFSFDLYFRFLIFTETFCPFIEAFDIARDLQWLIKDVSVFLCFKDSSIVKVCNESLADNLCSSFACQI